jgi:hypothetical protein
MRKGYAMSEWFVLWVGIWCGINPEFSESRHTLFPAPYSAHRSLPISSQTIESPIYYNRLAPAIYYW